MSEQERNDQEQVAAESQQEPQVENLPQPEVSPEQAEQAKGGGMAYWEYWEADNV